MSELQEVMKRYGETSVRNYQIIHPIGEKLIEGFDSYLGVPGCVLGVPPTGAWEESNTDYCDAKFSTYGSGLLSVGPISMGLAVRIPHTNDAGAFWMRVVLEFLIEGSTFSVRIGDGKTVGGLPIDCTESDLHLVYGEIYSYVKDFFVHPVSYFEAELTGKIGFLAQWHSVSYTPDRPQPAEDPAAVRA
jgi:hypothetical protein